METVTCDKIYYLHSRWKNMLWRNGGWDGKGMYHESFDDKYRKNLA
jgi:hypothetical protein